MLGEIERLHLERDDTVVSVRERLSRLRGRRVLLIWPEAGQHLRRKLDLILIQREAYRRAIQLALVSTDSDVVHYAGDLNISCFESVEASARGSWKRGRQKVFLPRYHRPKPGLQAEDLEIIAERIARRGRRSSWRAALERLLVLALLIGALGASLYVVLPSADVYFSLNEKEITVVLDIVADRKATGIDLEKGVIPAQIFRENVETTVTLPTSGNYWLVDSVSSAGVVTFTNQSSGRVEIPPGAILGTSAGEPILFETMADVVLPAGVGRRVDATVQAMAGYRGSIGNVGPGMVNTVLGALADQVAVINLAAFSGGGSRSVKTVAAEDQAKLLNSARMQLQAIAFEKMRATLPQSEVIVLETIAITEERKDWKTFSAEIGTMTSELSLTMRAGVSALAVDERYARQVVQAKLKAAMPMSGELLPETMNYRRGPFALSRSGEMVTFTATGSAIASATIDRGSLREQLAGISLDSAQELLAGSPAVARSPAPQIDLHPAELGQMPTLAFRVRVHIRDRQ